MRIPHAQDVRAAAGTGQEVFEESSDTHLLVARELLPRSVHIDQLIALRATGTSMMPTIRDGDTLVMDRASREPQTGRIYVLRTETGLAVKRLKNEGGAWIMTSDNPEWKPRPVGPEDRVLGHVVWFGPERAVEAGG